MLGISVAIMGYNRTARRTQQIRWHYDATDPTVITLAIPDFCGAWTTWTLVRTLFDDAYLHSASLPSGDAHTWVANERFAIKICGQPGQDAIRRHCVISFPAEAVWEFLTTTRKLVPPCTNNGQCTEGCIECGFIAEVLEATLAALLPEQH